MNIGYIYALLAFGTWGIIPIYWSLFKSLDSTEVLCHRIIWSFVFYTFIVGFKKIKDRATAKQKLYLLIAGLLIGFNWWVYIWAINNGHVAESSLGYFINPLMNFSFGFFIFKEKLSQPKRIAILFATIGVLYLTWIFHTLPWIALSLAFTFALYGIIKKKVQLPSALSVQIETLFLLPLGLGYFLQLGLQNPQILISRDFPTWLIILSTGVITALPLIWFTSAAKRIPLSYLGFFQYLAPTLQFLCAIFYFKEDFNKEKAIGFLFVWVGILIAITEALFASRRSAVKLAKESHSSRDKT